MAHKHQLAILYDEEKNRLFAFCGADDYTLVIEADEIVARLEASFELDSWTAEDIVEMLGHSLAYEVYKVGAKKLINYAEILKPVEETK